jgi:hypothetical protein
VGEIFATIPRFSGRAVANTATSQTSTTVSFAASPTLCTRVATGLAVVVAASSCAEPLPAAADPEPASPGVGTAKVGLLSAGGANASANGTEGTLVRHCDSVGYAHRVDGSKLSDAAFFTVPALNGDSRQDAISLMSTNEAGAWLGLDNQKGNRLVLMGGKISTGDKNAGSFLKVPPLTQRSEMAANSFSLESLVPQGPTAKALYVTQFFESPATVGCGGCISPNGAAPSPAHKYGQCRGWSAICTH